MYDQRPIDLHYMNRRHHHAKQYKEDRIFNRYRAGICGSRSAEDSAGGFESRLEYVGKKTACMQYTSKKKSVDNFLFC